MGLLEALAHAAGTVSHNVKKTLGISTETPEHLKIDFSNHPRNERGELEVAGWTDQPGPPEERTMLTIPAQMNSVKAAYDKEVRAIFADLDKLNKKLGKAKSETETQQLQEQSDKINARFEEIKAEVKVKIDKIRSRYDLAHDDDQSHPNWGYRV